MQFLFHLMIVQRKIEISFNLSFLPKTIAVSHIFGDSFAKEKWQAFFCSISFDFLDVVHFLKQTKFHQNAAKFFEVQHLLQVIQSFL